MAGADYVYGKQLGAGSFEEAMARVTEAVEADERLSRVIASL
jgi:hypothetical protein